MDYQKWYQSRFDVYEKSLNGEATTEVHALRRLAMAKFRELGFPQRNHEEWRFTNIAPITSGEFIPSVEYDGAHCTEEELDPFLFDTPVRLTFVNGRFAPHLSRMGKLPAGVLITSFSFALKSHPKIVGRYLARYASYQENPFVALNTAFAHDGAVIVVPKGIELENPIHLLFVGSGQDGLLITPRNLVILEDQAKAAVVETYHSLADTACLTNVVTEVALGEGAILEHDKLQDESLKSFHIADLHIAQQAGSVCTSNSVSLGGAIARNNIVAVLDAERSECTLNGLAVGTGDQLIDNHTTIDHAKPRCESHELYKSVLDGRARGVFNGKIFVRKDAQKTDAKQTNKTLLLSDDARIDTKPQLEIFADDVKCTHGATVGQLDEEQIFYLRSRGIDRTQARDILTFAFASDVVGRVHGNTLKEKLEGLVRRKLDEGRRQQ